MKQIELDKLQTQLEEFGKTLTVQQCEEFRQIIFSIGVLHNSVGDIYKYAELALIPSKLDAATTGAVAEAIKETDKAAHANMVNTTFSGTFKPSPKGDLTSIAMTLAKNLELNLKKE